MAVRAGPRISARPDRQAAAARCYEAAQGVDAAPPAQQISVQYFSALSVGRAGERGPEARITTSEPARTGSGVYSVARLAAAGIGGGRAAAECTVRWDAT